MIKYVLFLTICSALVLWVGKCAVHSEIDHLAEESARLITLDCDSLRQADSLRWAAHPFPGSVSEAYENDSLRFRVAMLEDSLREALAALRRAAITEPAKRRPRKAVLTSATLTGTGARPSAAPDNREILAALRRETLRADSLEISLAAQAQASRSMVRSVIEAIQRRPEEAHESPDPAPAPVAPPYREEPRYPLTVIPYVGMDYIPYAEDSPFAPTVGVTVPVSRRGDRISLEVSVGPGYAQPRGGTRFGIRYGRPFKIK